MPNTTENILIRAIRKTKGKDRETVINQLSHAFVDYPHIGDHALNELGQTPLIVAVQEQNEWAVEWLLDEKRLGILENKKPRVNYLDHKKMSALMYAVQYQDAEQAEEKTQADVAKRRRITKLLLQYDADPWNIEVLKEGKNASYHNAILEAAKFNNIHFLEFFFQNYWKDVNEKMGVEDRYVIQCLLMNWAVKHNNHGLIHLLAAYMDIGKGMNALLEYSELWGASSKYCSDLSTEITRGYIDPEISNFKFSNGATRCIPYIFSAIKTDDIELAALLLKEKFANAYSDHYVKSDPGSVDVYPLDYIIQCLRQKKLTLQRAMDFVELLVEHGAKVRTSYDNEPGVRPWPAGPRGTMIYQVMSNLPDLSVSDRLKILNLLMEKANLKEADRALSALECQVDWAIIRKQDELARYLLSKGYPRGKLKMDTIVAETKATKSEPTESFSLDDLNKIIKFNNAIAFEDLMKDNKVARDLVKEKCDEILCNALNEHRNNIVKELIPYYDPMQFEQKSFGFFAKLLDFFGSLSDIFGFVTPSKVLNTAASVGNIDAVKQLLAKGATLTLSTFEGKYYPRVYGYLRAVSAIRGDRFYEASQACYLLNDADKKDLYLLCLANPKQRALVEKIVGNKIIDGAFEKFKELKDTTARVLSLAPGAVSVKAQDESKRTPKVVSFRSDLPLKTAIFKEAASIKVPAAVDTTKTLACKI